MNQTFDVPVTMLDSQAALTAILPRLETASVIALDTEFRREDTFYPELCLMQLATRHEIFLVDNLCIEDMRPLWDVLCDGNRVKILHSARQDLELLLALCGTVLQPVFDTQIAAAFLGNDLQLGYATLVEDRLGVALSKSQTRTQWCARPLSAAQLDYAVEDVLHLHRLMDSLSSDLSARGYASWFLEDCAELYDPDLYQQPVEISWQRIKGAGDLDAAARIRLAALAEWREVRARKANKPRQWIVKDRQLIAIAQCNAIDYGSLADIADLAPGQLRRYGRELLAAAQRTGIDPGPGPAGRPDEAQRTLLRKLKSITKTRADQIGIRPELLAGRRDLQAVAQGQRQGLRVLTGWRLEEVGRKLLLAAGL